VEIAIGMKQAAQKSGGRDITAYVGVFMLAIGFIFAWRSFYAMRIPKEI
jgi:hypothetical protein